MEIRRIGTEEVREIYRTHIQEDFPEDERKPLAIMLDSLDNGTYACFAGMEDGTLLGYGFFVQHGQRYLLDYLAVVRDMRSQGIGGAFLPLLIRALPEAECILAEVEDPQQAATEAEAAQRERRMAFYRRCGFADSGVTVQTFGVTYRLVDYSPTIPRNPDIVRNLYGDIYRAMLPKALYRQMIRFQ